MDPGKEHFRHVLFFLFKRGKTAAEAKKILCDTYGDGIVSMATRRRWHRRFHSGNFDALLDDNSAVTTQELAEALDVHRTTVCLRLHGMGKIQKCGKWVPHSLSESAKTDRLNTCKELLKNHRKKSFLWRIVTRDEKWVLYDNPKRKNIGRTQVKRPHPHQSPISMGKRCCSVYGGTTTACSTVNC
ncbi:hypothetical protein M513_11754 [Trichuris suis]|uniref:Mos1 transposase HTH domain-containing protein n=1 Tax=Trichuris suis TaxID=68888 RepID=A0A085LQZ5_9BILA|nr:hypothetical protein M513_11754 [Trichuris suis]